MQRDGSLRNHASRASEQELRCALQTAEKQLSAWDAVGLGAGVSGPAALANKLHELQHASHELDKQLGVELAQADANRARAMEAHDSKDELARQLLLAQQQAERVPALEAALHESEAAVKELIGVRQQAQMLQTQVGTLQEQLSDCRCPCLAISIHAVVI